MYVLPSRIVFDIFIRLNVRCLARSRCVSKVWCNYIDYTNPYIRVVKELPILYHVIESIQTGTTHDYVLKPKEGPFLEFLPKEPLFKSLYPQIEVLGSCNGHMCLSHGEEYNVVNSLVVVHPLTKECYELPPLPMCFESSMLRESCGLGFDASTNTLKMVLVLLKVYSPTDNLDMVRKNLCTMVHVFGTNSWREIPQVPSYPIAGKAIFANGCLHWLVSHLDAPTQEGGRPVIWFDVEKEEFGLIDPPKRMGDLWRNSSCAYDHLVDLNGEVGYVCLRSMEVWVLKQKEWVPHCRFEKQIVPYGDIEVLGCWNKDGDMLITTIGDGNKFFVYNLKSGVLHKTNIVLPVSDRYPNMFMDRPKNKLFSIHGIGTNSFLMKEISRFKKKLPAFTIL